jgi:hypothetical protein
VRGEIGKNLAQRIFCQPACHEMDVLAPHWMLFHTTIHVDHLPIDKIGRR